MSWIPTLAYLRLIGHCLPYTMRDAKRIHVPPRKIANTQSRLTNLCSALGGLYIAMNLVKLSLLDPMKTQATWDYCTGRSRFITI